VGVKQRNHELQPVLGAALVCFALAVVALAALLFSALGCARSPSSTHAPQRPAFPSWVPADLRAEAEAEIAAAGVPAGWRVVVMPPVFEHAASPTGIARGICDYESKTLFVGWRITPYEDRPLLPALIHETLHAVTGDPLAGH
jgi:hypothetical protein